MQSVLPHEVPLNNFTNLQTYPFQGKAVTVLVVYNAPRILLLQKEDGSWGFPQSDVVHSDHSIRMVAERIGDEVGFTSEYRSIRGKIRILHECVTGNGEHRIFLSLPVVQEEKWKIRGASLNYAWVRSFDDLHLRLDGADHELSTNAIYAIVELAHQHELNWK